MASPRTAPVSAPADDASAPVAAVAAAPVDATAPVPAAEPVSEYGGFAIAPGPGTLTYKGQGGIELTVKTN